MFLSVCRINQKPGFLTKILVVGAKIVTETRFLGYLRGLRNRVSTVDATDNCDMRKRNPVSRLSARDSETGFLL
jgi:hypothetical protein